MTGLPALIVHLAVQSVRAPRDAARWLIALDPPNEARWIGLLLVSVLALIETSLGLLLIPMEGRPAGFAVLADPVMGVPAQVVSLLVLAGAIAGVGRLFGGIGTFADALLLVVWLEFLLVVAQAVQILLFVLVPPLGLLIAYAALAMFVWLLVHFVAALHGFTSLAKVTLGMVLSFFAIVTVLALILGVLGIAPPVEKG